jgi:hypothetical protein
VRHARGQGKKARGPKRGVDAGDIEPIDWDGFYLAARALGISPTDFWDMTLPEFLCEIEGKAPRGGGDYAGKLTQADVEELAEWMHGDGA